MANTPFESDELLKHSRFVKRLALQLARDDDSADELAAQTMAVALEQQPATGPSLRAWLRRVMERRFWHERRDSERRTRRERAALESSGALDATAPATVELVARIELEQKIAAAFSALAPPYKETLFQRYFDDLTPTAIAARDGISVETVKTRLKRGLAQLREELDSGHAGRREEWRLRALQIAGAGVPIVATKGKVAAVSVAALLLASTTVALVQPWSRGDGGARADDGSLAKVDASERGEEDDLAARDRAAIRAAARVDRAGMPFASGVVVDGDGAPLSGVRVVPSRLQRVKQSTRHFVRVPDFGAADVETLATTDGEGRFAVVDEGEDLVSLFFLKEGFRLGEKFEFEAECAANQAGRIVLLPARRVRGSARDTEGRPIVEAHLSCWTEGAPGTRIARHLADRPEYLVTNQFGTKLSDDGRFNVSWIPWESFSVSIGALGYLGDGALRTSRERCDPWEATLVRTFLVIDAVDAETGALIPHATVLLSEKASGRALQSLVPTEFDYVPRSRAEFRPTGRLYQRTGFGQPSEEYSPRWLRDARDQTLELRMYVLADGYVAGSVDATVSRHHEPPHLIVDLTPDDGSQRPAVIAGRVIGAVQTEIALHVLAFDENERALQGRTPLLKVAPAADGSFAIADLPAGRYRLVATSPGAASKTLDVTAPCGGLVFELGPTASLAITVKDRAGALVPDARVVVQGEDGKSAWSSTTDAKGVAVVDGLPEGEWRLLATRRTDHDGGDAPQQPLPAECFDPSDRATVRAGKESSATVALIEPVSMALHFERDDGTPVANVMLEPRGSEGPVLAAPDRYALLNRFRVEPDSHGDAVVTLHPGNYRFRARETTVMRIVSFDVPRDGRGRATLRLPVVGATGTLRGRLVDEASGGPIARHDVLASMKLERFDPIELGMVTTDAEGRLEFAEVPVGRVELTIRGDTVGGTSDGGHMRIDDRDSPWGSATRWVSVAAGERVDLEFALPPVRSPTATFAKSAVEVRVVDAASKAPLGDVDLAVVALRGADEELELGTLHCDRAGIARADLFAAGRYRLRASRFPDASSGSPAIPEQEFEVAATGDTLAVTIELTATSK